MEERRENYVLTLIYFAFLLQLTLPKFVFNDGNDCLIFSLGAIQTFLYREHIDLLLNNTIQVTVGQVIIS